MDFDAQNVFLGWPNRLKKLLHLLEQASIEGKLTKSSTNDHGHVQQDQ
jgi:hypothetical protein